MTNPKQSPFRRQAGMGLALILLALVPAGYLYLTGRLDRRALQRTNDELVERTKDLADSLDGTRAQLLLHAAMAGLRRGDYEGARALVSDFFAQVDRRTRQPGAGAQETQARMGVLALRDRAITELSRQTPDATRILEELAALHLALADPALKARIPTAPAGSSSTAPSTRDTLPGRTVRR